MKVIVIGCGRLGSELAYRLCKQNHEVIVVDISPASFNNLPTDFTGRMVEGDALNREVLHRASIESAQALAMVTDCDSLNAVIAHVAKTFFNVPNVIVRNYDTHYRSLHEIFNLQMVSATSWGAQRIEEMFYHADVHCVFSAGNGEVEVYEFLVPTTWNGRKMGDLICSDQVVAVALTRAGKAILPNCDIPLEDGDVINISATLQGVQALRRQLDLVKEA